MKKIISCIMTVLIFASCSTLDFIERESNKAMLSYNIRVKLIFKGEVRIKRQTGVIVVDAISGGQIGLFDKAKQITIGIVGNRTLINGKIIESPIIIKSVRQKLLNINGKNYFGIIKIIPKDNSYAILNILPIEAYLMCVLPSEVPLYFEPEALKTQVIIARTYSYRLMLKFSRRSFDVDNTTTYQVYNGLSNNLKRKDFIKIKKAIKETSGQIILFNNAPIVAYYHSNSGGIIFSGKEYFGSNSDLPYLVHKTDPFSAGYPGYKWRFSISKKDFEERFGTSKIDYKNFAKKDDEGFVQKIIIDGVEYAPKAVRRMVGYRNIKSTKFKITVNENTIIFDGFGYGHGVGLSQWGAQGMAEQGYTYREIIDFYYPYTAVGYY